jgi:putative sigma-54 modulation protein
MKLNITARHLPLTTAIKEYVEKKIEKAERFHDNLIWAQVVLDVSKRRHVAEIILHAGGRHTFTAKEESADLYAAVDLASDNMDEQLRRHKERHRSQRSVNPRRTARSKAWDKTPSLLAEEPLNSRVSSSRVLKLSSLSVNEAIVAMEESDSAHWIFLNRENRRVTVLYRKPDKTYGVVESIS